MTFYADVCHSTEQESNLGILVAKFTFLGDINKEGLT